MNKITFILCFICCISCIADTWEGYHRQDTELGTWNTIDAQGTEMPLARYSHSMVSYNSKYYIACGTKSGMYGSADIWCMDIANSTQTFTQEYNNPDEFNGTYGHASLVWNNKLYVFFGRMLGDTDTIYSYDFEAARKGWTKENGPTSDQFEPRINFAIATISDKLYVFGGEQPVRPYLITDNIFGYFSYSSTTQEWTFQKIELSQDIPGPRARHSMIAIGSTLYLFGGRGEEGVTNTLWKCNVTQDRNNWQKNRNRTTRRRNSRSTLLSHYACKWK